MRRTRWGMYQQSMPFVQPGKFLHHLGGTHVWPISEGWWQVLISQNYLAQCGLTMTTLTWWWKSCPKKSHLILAWWTKSLLQGCYLHSRCWMSRKGTLGRMPHFSATMKNTSKKTMPKNYTSLYMLMWITGLWVLLTLKIKPLVLVSFIWFVVYANTQLTQGDLFDDAFILPTKLIWSLQRWLKSMFGQKFSCNRNLIEHGTQMDGYSCGIILGNTVEHAINVTPIWKHRWAIVKRLCWFWCLAKGANNVKGNQPEITSSKLSKATKKALMENVELSISIALGDHNFPDLTQFALGSDSESKNDLFPEAPALKLSTTV